MTTHFKRLGLTVKERTPMARLRNFALAVAATAVWFGGSIANADLIYDSMTAGVDGTHSVGSQGPLAGSFSTGTGSTSILLSQVSLLLSADNPSDGGNTIVTLLSNATSNNGPGSLLATLGTVQDSALPTTPTTETVTLTLATPFTLDPGTRYWIELGASNSSGSSVEWWHASNSNGVGVANEYWYVSSLNPPIGPTVANSFAPPFQMQVTTLDVAAVPEPSTAIVAVFGAVAFVAYGWSRHRREQRRQGPVGQVDTTP